MSLERIIRSPVDKWTVSGENFLCMDDLEVSTSPFAWSWVIKVLATHDNVNSRHLHDLIQHIPELYDNLNKELSDDPYKQTSEAIALRSLESVFHPAMLSNSGLPSSSDQEEIHFDSSESVRQVLKHVMDLPSMSSLRKDGKNPLPNVRKCSSDKLVGAVHAYIERKKATITVPESPLQELHGILQKGEADLEWKRSCLKTQELMQIGTLEAQSGNSPSKVKLLYDNTGSIACAEKSASPLVSSDMQVCPIDDQSDKFLSGNKHRHDGNDSAPSKELRFAVLISSDMPDCLVDDQAYNESKKASVPESSLQELSDIQQKADACHETDLEWERSSLKTLELMPNSTSETQSGNSPSKMKLVYHNTGSIASAEKSRSSLISSDMQDCPIDDRSGKFLSGNKRRHNGNDLAPSISSDMPDCLVDDQSDNLLSGNKCTDSDNGAVPCTEWKFVSSISTDMQDCRVDAECGLSPPGKKLRHDGNGSSFSEKNSAEENCPIDGQSGNSPPEKQSHDRSGSIASTERNSDPLVSSDINEPYPLSPKPAQPTGLLTCWPSDVLNEIERRHAEIFLTPDVTELDICIKCHKDGEVLFCRGSSCPVVVHERCLGITESIDNRDSFLCPFCVCSLAKSKYTEAKERMLVARENLTLFVGGIPDKQPKEFAEVDANPSRQGRVDGVFKGKGIYQADQASTDKQRDSHSARDNVHSSTPKCLSKQAEGIKGNNCRTNRQFTNVNPISLRKGRDERKLKGKKVNLVGQAPTDEQHEGHVEQDTANSCQAEKRFVLVPPPTDDHMNDHVPPDNVHNSTDKQASTDDKGNDAHQARQASKYEQQSCHLAPDNVHNSPSNCFSKEGEDRTEKICQPEKRDQMIPIEKFDYAGVSSGVSTQKRLDRLAKKASYTSPGNLVVTPERRSRRAKISDNFLSPQSKRRLADQQGASTATLDDCDEISEEEISAATTSRLPQRFENKEISAATTSSLPQRFENKETRLYPNRVPWTEKEVEMLKEGVKRFGPGNSGNMPWSTILEFGTGVFWRGRNGVSLKDKWRNLLKINPDLR